MLNYVIEIVDDAREMGSKIAGADQSVMASRYRRFGV